jgi:OmpA-OmpF porin, OOP family
LLIHSPLSDFFLNIKGKKVINGNLMSNKIASAPHYLSSGIGLMLFLLAFPTNAQTSAVGEGFDLQQFHPAPAGDSFFSVPQASASPWISTNRQKDTSYGFVRVLGDYAHKPLEVTTRGDRNSLGFLVDNQVYTHLQLGLSDGKHWVFSIGLPVSWVQSGDDVGGTGVSRTAKLGDVPLALRRSLVKTRKKEVEVAAQIDMWLPTGSREHLSGDGRVRALPRLIVGGELGPIYYTTNVGVLFRRHLDLGTPEIGTALSFGAGAGVHLANRHVLIGPELWGNSVFAQQGSDTPFFGKHSTPVEAMLAGQVLAGDFTFGAGLGSGITSAPGTAKFRAILSVGWQGKLKTKSTDDDHDGIDNAHDACPNHPGAANSDPRYNGCPPPPPPSDGDHDGIADAHDACPTEPGSANADPKKNGCPGDSDGDNILDNKDACPQVAGVANQDPAKNGCPLSDTDSDGIPDSVDACLTVPGVKQDDPKKNGCPSDSDNDNIADSLDACPKEAGLPNSDAKKNGCPADVSLVGDQIQLHETIQFEKAKSKILPESESILTKVAAILKDHQEIRKISIEGHTDNTGNKNVNRILSLQRAQSVRTWLASKGKIKANRMVTKGWGDTKPKADNETDEGRLKNRRVEFHILERATTDKTKPAPRPKFKVGPSKKKKP